MDQEQVTPTVEAKLSSDEVKALREKKDQLSTSIRQTVLDPKAKLPEEGSAQQLRSEYVQLTEQAETAKQQTERLTEAKLQVEPLAQECQGREKELAAARESLSEFYQPLGAAAFAAQLAGQIKDVPVLADRLALHEKVTQLQQESEALTPSADAKMLEKTKAKAQQLAAAGKIKIGETKIGKLDKQIGQQLLGEQQEETVRCEETSAILDQISKRRTEISEKEAKVAESTAAFASSRDEVTKKLALSPFETVADLNTQIKESNTLTADAQKQLALLERELPDRLIADEELRSSDSELGQQVQELAEIQAQLKTAGSALDNVKEGLGQFATKIKDVWGGLSTRGKAVTAGGLAACTLIVLSCGLGLLGVFEGGAEPTEDSQVAANNGGPAGQRVGPGPTIDASAKSARNVKALYEEYQEKQRAFSRLCANNPRVRIHGEIRDREGTVLSIWGQAFPVDGNAGSPGVMFDKGNLMVLNADTSLIRANYYVGGIHYYASRGAGVNAFGVSVPVLNYGGPPDELKHKSAALKKLETKYHSARRDAVAKTLKKLAQPEGGKSEALERLKKTVDGLGSLSSYRGVEVGDLRDKLDTLPQKKTLGHGGGFFQYLFPDDGVIISTTVEHVTAITWVLQPDTLAQYFSFLKELQLTKSAPSMLSLDAPLLSKHIRLLGWRGIGPIWTPRTAELVAVKVEAIDGSVEKNDYRFLCLSADQRLYALAVMVHNDAVAKAGAGVFDTRATDRDPLLDSELKPSHRVTKLSEPIPAADYLALKTEWKGYKQSVLDAAFSSDGRRAASGGEDGNVVLWHVASGSMLHTFKGHRGSVATVAYAAGERLVSGGADGHLRVWDAAAKKPLHDLTAHESDVLDVAVSADGSRAISGGADRAIHVWDLKSGKKLKSLASQTDWVSAVALSPDGKTALTGSRDGSLIVWDVDSGKAVRQFTEHQGAVSAIALANGGQQAVSGDDKGNLFLWDIKTGKIVRQFIGRHREHGDDEEEELAVTKLSVSGGGHAVSAHQSGVVFLWHLNSPVQRHAWHFPGKGLSSLACAVDGRRFVVDIGRNALRCQFLPPPATEGELAIGELASFAPPQLRLDRTTGNVWKAWMSPDRKQVFYHLVTASQHLIVVEDISSGRELRRHDISPNFSNTYVGNPRLEALILSPQQRYAVASVHRGIEGAPKGHGELWDLEKGKRLRTFKAKLIPKPPKQTFNDGEKRRFENASRMVMGFGCGDTYMMYVEYALSRTDLVVEAIASGEEMYRIELQRPQNSRSDPTSWPTVIYSPGGRYAVTIWGETAQVLDLKTGKRSASIADLPQHPWTLTRISLSDTRLMYPALQGSQFKSVELESGKVGVDIPNPLPRATPRPISPVISPDGRLAAFLDNKITLVNLETGRETRKLSTPAAHLRFMPDGKRVIISNLPLLLAPDGRRAMTYTGGSSRGTHMISIWDIDREKMIHKFVAGTGNGVTVWGLPSPAPATVGSR